MTNDIAVDHLGIAEGGKLRALRGDHRAALRRYREAMRIAVQLSAPEVFFRHYLESAIESLELMGDYTSVLDYCDRALEHYRQHPPPNPLAVRDHCFILQRRAVVLLKAGHVAEAGVAVRAALAAAGSADPPLGLPLLATIGRWIDSRLHITPERITAEQSRHGYFSVRPDTVNPRRAVEIPEPIAPQPFEKRGP